MKKLNINRGGAFALVKTSLLMIALCLGALVVSPPPAQGGAFDLLNGDTNIVQGVCSNVYALYTDTTVYSNGTVNANNKIITTTSRDAWLSATGYFTNNAASVANVRVILYPSCDTFNYLATSNVVIWIAVPATSSNYYTGLAIAPAAFPQYSIRSVDNTNAGCGTVSNTLKVKAFTKNGI